LPGFSPRMRADAGADVTLPQGTLTASLRDIAAGSTTGPEAAARVSYLAEVLQTKVSGDHPPDAGPELRMLAAVVMQYFGKLSAAKLRGRLGSLRVIAASRLRASHAAARQLRSAAGEVEALEPHPSHAGFFGLDVQRLRYRRFDGEMSPWLEREIFVAGDAVTVLPYDPLRDRVLLIEQMRMGPLGRGDPLPWQLEAIAGRIDPGETPEDAARREAVEEAGLALGTLVKVAEYYPTPGAVTEYLYSYVALCDLPDGVAGIFGAEEEAEDIRGHLLDFADFMRAVAGGEVANAPLLLTALWLERERGRLRGAGSQDGEFSPPSLKVQPDPGGVSG
jgi:ADP-ribose pyrophosphatase